MAELFNPATQGTSTFPSTARILRRALLVDYRIDEGTGTALASDTASAASPGDDMLTLQGSATLSPTGMTNASTSAGGATGTLPAALTATRLSVYWIGRSPVGVNHGQGGMIYGDYSSNNFGLKYFYDSTNPAFGVYVTAAFGGNNASSTLVRLDDNTYHVWSAVYDGACLRLYRDGALIGYTEATIAAQTVSAINLGCFFSDGSYGFQGDIVAAMLYAIDHSPAQVRLQTLALQQFAASKRVTVPTLSRLFIAEGDSITQGNGVAPWVTMVAIGLTPATPAFNLAIPSATINGGYTTGPNANNNLVYRAKYVDAAFGGAPAHGVLAVACGHNDQAYATPAVSYASYKAYCLARRTAGARKIIACSLLPSSSSAFNTWRNAWNALLYADSAAGGVYDGLIDWAADGTIGPDAAGSNTTYYPDGVHPSTAGQTIMASVAQPVIASALNA